MLSLVGQIAMLQTVADTAVTQEPYLRIWWIFCAILVFLMQVGFMLVETGFVRERSMSGIALKTFLMLLASSLAYSVVGYRIMYGPDLIHGWIGWGTPHQYLGMEWQFYQTGFAAVAATIISGAIAERTTLRINVLIAFLIGGLIYPVVGHWAWAEDGWLHIRGFHDLAGSGVVHFLGGVASIAAAWIAGPRLDKYDPNTQKINDYLGERSLPLVSCGVLFLWLGWMGFNGGSVRNANELGHAGYYLLSTGCAASAGGFAILLLSPAWDLLVKARKSAEFDRGGRNSFLSKGELVRPFDILPATMGGMVAVTANSDLLIPHYLLAIPIGVAGGIAVFVASKLLRSDYVFRLGKIDDPAEAIAVHAAAGATGVLIASIFFLRTPHFKEQLITQALGLLAIGTFTFAVVAIVFYLLNGRAEVEKPATQTNYYSETFGPRVWPEKSPVFEVLGKVHYWFATDWVRSTQNEEYVGLRFEPRSVRPAPFLFRTTSVADELKTDIQEFFAALVSVPIHSLDSSIKYSLKEKDFLSPETYKEVRQNLLGVIDRMQTMGVMTLDPEPVVLSKIVRDVCDEFAKKHKFITDRITEGDLNGDFRVQGQHELLETAVRVLFSNAARAVITRAATGGEPDYIPMVSCELNRDAYRVVLSVIDNGGGLSQRVRERLFEPFNKGEVMGRHGLGLFYAAKVAEAFDGRLVLQSNGDVVTPTRFDLILEAVEET